MEHNSTLFVDQNCPLCQSGKGTPLFRVRHASEGVLKLLNIHHAPRIFLNECRSCSHHYISPVISSDGFSDYYLKLNSEYYNSVQGGQDHQFRLNKKIVEEVERVKTGGRILEIGSGYGHLLNSFDKSNWAVRGIEPASVAWRYAKHVLNLQVKNELFEKNVYPAGRFDVIIMADVIEHIHNPVELMAEVNRILVPGGIAVLITGNFNSISSRVLKQYWGYYSSYEHISFYTPESMTYLLNKTGFTVKKIKPISHCGSVNVELGRLFTYFFQKVKLLVKQSLSLKFSLEGFLRPELLFYDHMLVICIKPGRSTTRGLEGRPMSAPEGLPNNVE